MGFFSNVFGKKTCALCGAECGVMSRTKIKNDQFLCTKCRGSCSAYVRLSEWDLDRVKQHMAYMQRQKRLYDEVFQPAPKDLTCRVLVNEGIQFCDALGMLYLMPDSSHKDRLPELLRYDQIASWEPYLDETQPAEKDKKPEFHGCGITLKMVQADEIEDENPKGLSAHPYIKYPIQICFTKSEKDREKAISHVQSVCMKLDGINGKHDSQRALFGFGMSKKESRDLKGAAGMLGVMGSMAKAAAAGRELTEEEQRRLGAKIDSANAAVQDANTEGMAVYTRRADAAEAKVK